MHRPKNYNMDIPLKINDDATSQWSSSVENMACTWHYFDYCIVRTPWQKYSMIIMRKSYLWFSITMPSKNFPQCAVVSTFYC